MEAAEFCRKLRSGVSCHGRRPTGKRGRQSHHRCARFVHGRRVALPRSALVNCGSYFCVRCCSVADLLSPARVATTVTRDSRITCSRWKAVGGGCARDRASALSHVSAPHWRLDKWSSQLGVVDVWATRGRAKHGRTHTQAKDVARSCVRVWCFGVALRAIIAKGFQFFRLLSGAEVWRMDSLRNMFELTYVQRSSCPTVTLAGTAAL